jgi:hypothetical protein
MTLKRLALMAVLTYGLLALWAWTGSTSNTETLYAPSVPATVTLGMLTAQQLEDRAEELTAQPQPAPSPLQPLRRLTRTPNAKNGSRLQSQSGGPTTLRLLRN